MKRCLFAIADGKVQLSGGDSGAKEVLTLYRGQGVRGEEQVKIFKENQMGLHHLKTHRRMTVKQETIVWSMFRETIHLPSSR